MDLIRRLRPGADPGPSRFRPIAPRGRGRFFEASAGSRIDLLLWVAWLGLVSEILSLATGESMDTDCNLLYGVLALQADLIDSQQFVEVCSLWTTRKNVPLADLLVERGWI